MYTRVKVHTRSNSCVHVASWPGLKSVWCCSTAAAWSLDTAWQGAWEFVKMPDCADMWKNSKRIRHSMYDLQRCFVIGRGAESKSVTSLAYLRSVLHTPWFTALLIVLGDHENNSLECTIISLTKAQERIPDSAAAFICLRRRETLHSATNRVQHVCIQAYAHGNVIQNKIVPRLSGQTMLNQTRCRHPTSETWKFRGVKTCTGCPALQVAIAQRPWRSFKAYMLSTADPAAAAAVKRVIKSVTHHCGHNSTSGSHRYQNI